MLADLAASLRVPLSPDEEWRQQLARDIFPHVQHFYDGWLSTSQRVSRSPGPVRDSDGTLQHGRTYGNAPCLVPPQPPDRERLACQENQRTLWLVWCP